MDNYKIGYSFSIENGEYIGVETVYLEKKTGLYPCADNVTFVEPPEVGEHQKQTWNGKEWDIVDDYRGSNIYDETGKIIGVVDFLGDVSSVIIKEPPVLADYEILSWDKVNREWVVSVKTGFIRDGENTREMTYVEKIEAGLEKLPDDMKIEGNSVVYKTIDELYNDGIIGVNEYNELITQERERRYVLETDKMGLMYLRGECTLEEWKSAMDKIREELPKKTQ